MRIGYAFWGFLGDYKMKNGQFVSTPDGNFFYSWAIIKALIQKGHTVYQMMPDRDADGFRFFGSDLFSSFCSHDRLGVYLSTRKLGVDFDLNNLPDLDILLLEWRFPIPGRNTPSVKGTPAYQPDLEIQNILLDHYMPSKTIVIAFDLDYKMTPEDDLKVDYVIELGFKRGPDHHVEIPFDFGSINYFPVVNPDEAIVYVGNRYERDWAVDKYLKPGPCQIICYGNWLESGRDSASRWPHISFRHRAQPSEFRDIYSSASVTPLLLKDEYCQHGFMTARLLESIFYGSLPVLISEFKSPISYVPAELVIDDSHDLHMLCKMGARFPMMRKFMINHLRKSLEFMDARCFVERIFDIAGRIKK